jgi:hypothetical protein
MAPSEKKIKIKIVSTPPHYLIEAWISYPILSNERPKTPSIRPKTSSEKLGKD